MTNLFAPIQLTAEDVEHLVRCNANIGRLYRYKKLFYCLKDALLHTYGQHDGYDLQEWFDYDWDSVCYGNDICDCKNEGCEIYAWHHHILERWLLGGRLFHRPTGEFLYRQNSTYGPHKKSDRYDELGPLCKEVIQGRKRWRGADRAAAWESLKHLVGRFGWLLDDAHRGGRRAWRRHQLRNPEPLPF